MLDRLGLEPWDITRTNEPDAKDVGLSGVPKDAEHREQWLDALVAHPRLIQRPIITADDGTTVVGRDPSRSPACCRDPRRGRRWRTGRLRERRAAGQARPRGHRSSSRCDRLGGAVGYVEQDGFRWDAGPTATALPAVMRDLFRKSGRPLERELELVPGRADARAPVRRRHAVLALPGRAAAPRSSRPSTRPSGRASGSSGSTTSTAFADDWDAAAPGLPRAPLVPRPRDKAHRRPCCARRHDAAQGAAQRRSRTSGCATSRCTTSGWSGHDPRNVPRGWGCGPTSSRASASGRCPAAWDGSPRRWPSGWTSAGSRCCSGTAALDLRLSGGRVVGVRTDARHARRRRRRVAIDPRGCPRCAPHVDRTMPAIPPVVCHLGLVGDVPDLPARGGAARRPDARAAHQRHRPRRGAAWTSSAGAGCPRTS